MFNNTGVEIPETLDFIKLIRKQWNLNFIETKPEKTYWQCVEQYGFPEFKSSRKKKEGKTKTPMCCYHLKEVPFRKMIKKHGFTAIFTGIREEESWNRRLNAIKMSNKGYHDGIKMCGQRYYAKKENVWKYHPITLWTHQQVWDYIKKNNLPYNKAYNYKTVERTGCMPCTAYMGWQEQLREINPKLYEMIQAKKGQTLLVS